MEPNPFRPKSRPTGYPGGGKPIPSRKISADVQAEIEAVRDTYVVCRSRWESVRSGGAAIYQAPRRYDGVEAVTVEGELSLTKAVPSAWASLANWCREQRVDPSTYVSVVFETIPPGFGEAPEPLQLKSTRYMQLYVSHAPRRREAYVKALRLQKDLARREILVRQSLGLPYDSACAETASDGSLSLSSLFRYCLAVSVNSARLRKIAKIYEVPAVLQMESARGMYLDVWIDVLPEQFPARSTEIYRHLLVTGR